MSINDRNSSIIMGQCINVAHKTWLHCKQEGNFLNHLTFFTTTAVQLYNKEFKKIEYQDQIYLGQAINLTVDKIINQGYMKDIILQNKQDEFIGTVKRYFNNIKSLQSIGVEGVINEDI